MLRDTNLARDGSTVIDPPQPDARAWWDDLGANPGLHASETAQEMAQWMTVAHDYNLGAQDTLYFWTILTTVRNGSLAGLEGQIATGTGWTFNDVLCCIPECANRCWGKVGDANGSGDDEPTIGDVSVMIDAKFITGTCDGIIPQLAEADINQSGEYNPQCNDITIGDISMLIDYLFIGGPNNVILPDCL